MQEFHLASSFVSTAVIKTFKTFQLSLCPATTTTNQPPTERTLQEDDRGEKMVGWRGGKAAN